MRILIYSPAFYPKIGGLENVTMILCKEFIKAGYIVKVITSAKSVENDIFEFEIIRNPNFLRIIQELKWCDIFYQPNVSLKGLLPWLWVRKPVVFSHNCWYTRRNGKEGLRDKSKFFFMKYGNNISVSRAVAEHIKIKSTVIPNPYDENIFNSELQIDKTKELVFVGRLVSDKGANILLNAISILKEKGSLYNLTIIGSGPEEENLRHLLKKLELEEQITFKGSLRGKQLAEEISRHKIIVVPSLWDEPFGIVALEGIACGCVVIGSDGGGLKDAIGKCGLTFRNSDYKELADKIRLLLRDENYLNSFKVHFTEHLEKHKPEQVAKKYIEVFEQAREKR
jgi:glycogen(starch) synthase